MHDLRNSTALRQLTDLGHESDPPEWVWAVTRLEPSGRLLRPVDARDALGAGPPLRERSPLRDMMCSCECCGWTTSN
jgi:hypothetical protein